MKDLFLDANIVKNFSNPLDKEYLKLIEWLLKYDGKKPGNNAFLVYSLKLHHEYNRTCRDANTKTCIHVILNKLIMENRLIRFSKEDVENFKRVYYKKIVKNRLLSNGNDKNHFIPIIMMSNRKFALIIDDNFCNDVNNFKGFSARAEKKPQYLPYR